MASLFFICPKTRHKASTGIETDAKSLQAAWTGTMKVDCPHCHAAHDISVRDTYIEAVAQDDSDRLYRFRLTRAARRQRFGESKAGFIRRGASRGSRGGWEAPATGSRTATAPSDRQR